MRGKQARVVSNLDDLHMEPASDEDGEASDGDRVEIAMPELQHNVRLLVELAEQDIRRLDVSLREEQDTTVGSQTAIGLLLYILALPLLPVLVRLFWVTGLCCSGLACNVTCARYSCGRTLTLCMCGTCHARLSVDDLYEVHRLG